MNARSHNSHRDIHTHIDTAISLALIAVPGIAAALSLAPRIWK